MQVARIYFNRPIHATPLDKVRWERARERYCRAGRFYNGRILEVDCGFGWDALGAET